MSIFTTIHQFNSFNLSKLQLRLFPIACCAFLRQNKRQQTCFLLFIILVGVCGSVNAATNKTDWKVFKSNDYLTVSYKKDPINHLHLIDAQLTVTSTLSGFLLFLQDYPNIPNWLDNAASATLIEQIAPNENVFITQFSAFWPVKNRELILHTKFTQLTDKSIEIQVADYGHALPETPNVIRMQLIKAFWKITPLEHGRLHIHYQVQVDPKGNLPRWLSNDVALKAMGTTLKNMYQQLPSSPFQQQTIPYIQERQD